MEFTNVDGRLGVMGSTKGIENLGAFLQSDIPGVKQLVKEESFIIATDNGIVVHNFQAGDAIEKVAHIFAGIIESADSEEVVNAAVEMMKRLIDKAAERAIENLNKPESEKMAEVFAKLLMDILSK